MVAKKVIGVGYKTVARELVAVFPSKKVVTAATETELFASSVASTSEKAAGKQLATAAETKTVSSVEKGVLECQDKKEIVCAVQQESTFSRSAKNSIKRVDRYAHEWEKASLSKAIEKFTPKAKGVPTQKGKIIYFNQNTGIQIVYDNVGNYFRIENTNLPGKRRYYDLDGVVPNNKTINGKQVGRNNAEYQCVTHFANIDSL